MKKVAELDKQIDHSQHELLDTSELNKTNGPILNLTSDVYFANAYEADYFFSGSSEKYNQLMGPYMMHRSMINHRLGNGYNCYNFCGLSGDFTENSEGHDVYCFKCGLNMQVGELTGSFYKLVRKAKYWLFTTSDKLRRKLREQM